jgi:dimethylaniline monooxygenase (N-oxide forming)
MYALCFFCRCWFDTIHPLARLYSGFWSQSGLRMAGFSDLPITLPPDAETYHDIFEAKYVTRYLEDYVDSHIYNDLTLRDRVRFGFKVRSIQKDGNWKVCGQHNEEAETIRASKLIVATGHTSIPVMPDLPDQDNFKGLVIHQKSFGKASSTVFAPSSVYQNVTILGGGKSAADMIYESVKSGKSVSWIIRQTGEGPAAFAAAAGKGPYRNGPEMAATRMISALSPSCFSPVTWWTRAIHGSNFGRNLLAKIWLGADQACRDLANFKAREGARPGFEMLESTTA